jgi:hypothetical protein
MGALRSTTSDFGGAAANAGDAATITASNAAAREGNEKGNGRGVGITKVVAFAGRTAGKLPDEPNCGAQHKTRFRRGGR